jgi:uncharacterized protein YkwD
MGMRYKISIRFQAIATAILMLSFIAHLLSCNGIMPAAGNSAGADGLSHQPSNFRHMEALVTPDDPLVSQALYDALNPPLPEPITVEDKGIEYTYVPYQDYSDFELLKAWTGKHCIYTPDKVSHGTSDYWQTPAETIELGSGDCEDHAILLCSLLRAYGVPADEVYVAVGSDHAGDAHAWLIEKYFTGLWRIYDENTNVTSKGPAIGSTQGNNFHTSYCFNDTTGFRGEPPLPDGVYEFESSVCYYPMDSGAADSIDCYCHAGQTITAEVEWLPYSVEWPFNPLVLEDWSLNVYDKNDKMLFTWSGTESPKTLEFTVSLTGPYRIELVKRDNPARPCRLTINPRTEITADTSVWKDDTPRVSAPVEIPQEQLAQHALDALNAGRISNGQSAIILGTNTAAQQHAEDMMKNRFVSGWGTDGTTPDERYALAGGLGTQAEYEQAVDIDWQGEPELFTGAVMKALEQATMSNFLKVMPILISMSDYYIVSPYLSSRQSTSIDTEQFKLQPDRVNIGIAYDGEKLYLVLQYESFYINFNSLPIIQDGILSFSGEYAQGVSPYIIYVEYRPLPESITATQISHTYGNNDYGDRYLFCAVNNGYESYVDYTKYIGCEFMGPHSVPLYLPPMESDTNMDDILGSISYSSQLTISRDNIVEFETENNAFLFSLDVSDLVKLFGQGVYVITIEGKVTTSPGSFVVYGSSTFTLFLE